jgi:hypothetical protein
VSVSTAPGAPLQWRKASASGFSGCVELAPFDGILIRDSKDPDGPVLAYSREEVAAFIDGAKRGEFDDLL